MQAHDPLPTRPPMAHRLLSSTPDTHMLDEAHFNKLGADFLPGLLGLVIRHVGHGELQSEMPVKCVCNRRQRPLRHGVVNHPAGQDPAERPVGARTLQLPAHVGA